MGRRQRQEVQSAYLLGSVLEPAVNKSLYYKWPPLEELKLFERSHNLKGAGLYVVTAQPEPTPLIKVGYSKNLMTRLSDYTRNLGGRLKILAVARIDGALGEHGKPVTMAERSMLQMIDKETLFNEREWVKGEYKDDAMRAFAYAHHSFAHGKKEGAAIYLGDDIRANRKTKRTSVEVRDGERVRELPVQADHPQYRRLRRLIRPQLSKTS